MKRIAGIFCLLIGLGCTVARTDAGNRKLDIYWCDVEGGAATLIVTPAGESILVDTGFPGERDAGRIAKTAKEVAGLKQIDHLITTHWHLDHFGGLGRLAELIPIGKYYDHGFPELPQQDINTDLVATYRKLTGGQSTILKPGDEIPLKQVRGAPRLSLRILAAHGIVQGEAPGAPHLKTCTLPKRHDDQPADTSDNARSLVFVLQFGEWQFFDGGDLTWNVEHKLACPKNLIGEVDVYQVTHHGLASSNHPAVVQAAKPRVAVMNNGPRKGGAPEVFRLLRSIAGMDSVFAVHRNVQTGPDDNALPEFTANDHEACTGESIRLSVAADAKSYLVSVPSKGTERMFVTR